MKSEYDKRFYEIMAAIDRAIERTDRAIEKIKRRRETNRKPKG